MLDVGGDTLSANWWRRVGIVADFAARQLRTQVYETKLQINLALLDYAAGERAFDMHHKQAEMARNNIVHELMPWVAVGPTTIKDSIALMRAQYVKHFADPQSEKGKAAIRKQLDKWGPNYARRFLPK